MTNVNSSKTPYSDFDQSSDGGLEKNDLPLEGPIALVGLLFQEPSFWKKSLRVELAEGAVIAIHLKGHFRGSWEYDGRAYHWTPAAYATPNLTVGSAAQAVACTICRLIAPQPDGSRSPTNVCGACRPKHDPSLPSADIFSLRRAA